VHNIQNSKQVNHWPTRHCIAAPDVDKNEPMMTTQGVGHASCATINPPPMLSPNLQQSVWLVITKHAKTDRITYTCLHLFWPYLVWIWPWSLTSLCPKLENYSWHIHFTSNYHHLMLYCAKLALTVAFWNIFALVVILALELI